MEVLFDSDRSAVDYRFLEVNPVFEQMTGIPASDALSGKTALQLIPDLERKWIEIYGHIAATGDPKRFDESSEVMNRWFSVYGFRVGGDGSSLVALLFNDVTAQKRAEQERIAAQKELLNALESVDRKVRERTNELSESNVGLDGKHLAAEIEINLYRIMQEALNNIWKHAHATNVSVLLELRDGTVSLIVEDDGVGFEPSEKAVLTGDDRGMGLLGMKERAELVGGTVEIEAVQRRGATIYVRVPARFDEHRNADTA